MKKNISVAIDRLEHIASACEKVLTQLSEVRDGALKTADMLKKCCSDCGDAVKKESYKVNVSDEESIKTLSKLLEEFLGAM